MQKIRKNYKWFLFLSLFVSIAKQTIFISIHVINQLSKIIYLSNSNNGVDVISFIIPHEEIIKFFE